MFYYEVMNVLGVGSMGSVAKVRKRDEVMGGSARKALVDSFSKERQIKSCFQIPLIGGLFRHCMDSDRALKNASSSLDDSFVDDRRVTTITSQFTTSSTDEMDFNESSLRLAGSATYEATYAMKSIHLDRVTDPTFIDELINEIEILQELVSESCECSPVNQASPKSI